MQQVVSQCWFACSSRSISIINVVLPVCYVRWGRQQYLAGMYSAEPRHISAMHKKRDPCKRLRVNMVSIKRREFFAAIKSTTM